ncbi:MAG: cache domain-containing protein, partial [Butyrivibrio sp.]|nr:cache domain-containing protein [Butyrivibrio sp.]
MKNRISVKIALMIGVVQIIAMIIFFAVMNYYLTGTLEDRAFRDMNVIAGDRAQLVETYIDGCCEFVSSYSKTTEVREALENPEDAERIRLSREMTTRMASDRTDIEGLYTAQWDTYVLAHINPDSVDQTFRDADAAAALEQMIRERGEAFCTGIVLAPVTRRMVIPVYAPIRNEQGEMIGFAGGAFYTDGLEEKLGALENSGDEEVGYSLINAATGVYIFDQNQELVGTDCTERDLLTVIGTLRDTPDDQHFTSYANNEVVASCYYMADRDWVFV